MSDSEATSVDDLVQETRDIEKLRRRFLRRSYFALPLLPALLAFLYQILLSLWFSAPTIAEPLIYSLLYRAGRPHGCDDFANADLVAMEAKATS